jgi:hypothetical protein
MEQTLAAIHQANPHRLPLTLELSCREKTVTLGVQLPADLTAIATRQLAAHYPDCSMEVVLQQDTDEQSDTSIWSLDLRLRPYIFPIRRYVQFEDALNRNSSDPLTGLLATLTPVGPGVSHSRIEMIVRPAARRRIKRARKAVRRLAASFFRAHPAMARSYALAYTSRLLPARFFTALLGAFATSHIFAAYETPRQSPSSHSHDREDDLQAAADKLSRHLFEVRLRVVVSASRHKARLARLQLRQMMGAFGQFTVPQRANFHPSRVRARRKLSSVGGQDGFLLSAEELATLWHPATATVKAPAIAVNQSREFEPPVTLPLPTRDSDLATLGRVEFRNRSEIFGIRLDDRRRHLAVIGKTGMGKTTLLQKLIASDIDGGRGVALVDPHGDLAETILDCVPSKRTNEVVVFDAGDRHFPLAFNPLACYNPEQKPLVASAVISAFKKLYGDSWGPRLEHIFRNALLALLEAPGASLLSLQRLLSEPVYRKTIAGRVTDPVVKMFWEREFAAWKPQYQSEATAPILNKVGQFLSQPILRAIVGQSHSRLDFRQIMDEGRILIVNLSKGKIGEDASNLLGSLVVSSMQLAAMSRADILEKDRRDFFLYVDEFQNFATESFATILSEARKYRLSLTIANQYLAQMDEATLDAVFGNVGSLLAFQVGARDAEVIAEQLGGDVNPHDLMALPKYTAYLRLLIDGMPSRPFSIQTLPLPRTNNARNHSDVIRRVSRHRYARPATEVEAEIRKAFAYAA